MILNDNDINIKEVEDSFGAFLVENAEFTEVEEYPILPQSFVANDAPNKVMPFFEAIASKEDLSNVFVYFNCADKTFERVRRYPKKYLPFFKRTAGIVGFDFSVYCDMPLIKQKAQLNDNLSLTYYYGKNGIPIIPFVRLGSDCTIEDYLTAFPKNSIIAIGPHGFIKRKFQKYEMYWELQTIVEKLHPKEIVVIGHMDKWIYEKYLDHISFSFYDTVIDLRNEVRKNGIKRKKQ